MLGREEVQKAMNKFGRDVVNTARSNFKHKSVTGKGERSIDYDIDVLPNSISQTFQMEDYMVYQDKGVSGTERKFNTPYKYTNKKPPIKAFDQWVVRRGLAGRDKQGKFISRKSLKFAISNYIFKKGIRPSLFFTKAFDKHFRDLPEEIVEAYGLDVERMMEATLNNRK